MHSWLRRSRRLVITSTAWCFTRAITAVSSRPGVRRMGSPRCTGRSDRRGRVRSDSEAGPDEAWALVRRETFEVAVTGCESCGGAADRRYRAGEDVWKSGMTVD